MEHKTKVWSIIKIILRLAVLCLLILVIVSIGRCMAKKAKHDKKIELLSDKEYLYQNIIDDRESLEEAIDISIERKGIYICEKEGRVHIDYKELNESVLDYIFDKYCIQYITADKCDENIVWFEMKNLTGIYTYVGFYYTEDNKHKDNANLTEYLVPSENGKGFEVRTQGCLYYTERITDNWFYYETTWH